MESVINIFSRLDAGSGNSVGASREVLDYVSRLPIGSHAALFHESEQLAAQILESYIRGGVKRLERIHFMSTSEEDQERFLKYTNENGKSPNSRKLVSYLSLIDFCFDNGRLSWRKAADQVRKLVGDVDGSSVKGVCVIVLADQYLRKASRDDLERFERQWGSFHLPLSVICCYDTRIIADPTWGDLILQLCKAHGHLIFKGLAASRAEIVTNETSFAPGDYSKSLAL